MTQETFWTLIEDSKQAANGDVYEGIEHLKAKLEQLSTNDLLIWHQWFKHNHKISYRDDLWGAAYLMRGGCSDDSFDYFRGWLIAEGREVFEAALNNPDSLANVNSVTADEDAYELEDMLSIAGTVYRKRTGEDYRDFFNAVDAQDALEVNIPERPKTEDWTNGEGDADKEKCARIYPKLWTIFGW